MDDKQKTKAQLIEENVALRKQIAKNHSETDANLINILNSLNAGIVVHGQDTSILYANPAACELLGISEGKIKGILAVDSQWEFFNADESEMTLQDYPISRVIATAQGLENYLMAIKRPEEDDLLWFLVNGYPVLDENDQIEQVVISIIDISGSKRAEEELTRSEQKFREVVDNSPFPVAVVDESDQNILFWSKSAQSLFGHNPKSAEEWYQLAYPDPEYRQDVIERWKPFLENAQESSGAVNTGEYRISCQDGSVKICELYAQIIPGSLIVTLHDITERTQAEQLLKESEEKYRLLHENAALGIGYYTPEGVVISYNSLAAKDMGGVPVDFEGKSIFDLFPKDAATFYFDRIQKAVKADEITLYEDFVQLPTQDKWFLSTYTKIVDSKNKILGIQIISQDISEQKRGEELLLQERQQAQQYLDIAGVLFMALDKTGSITLMNQKGCDILGYTEAEILNKNWFDLCISDDNLEEIKGVFKQVLSGNIDIVEYYENSIVTKTGEQKIIAFRNSFINDKESNITGILSSGEDITERKKAEQALQEGKAFNESLLNTSPDIIYIYDIDEKKNVYSNDGLMKILGYTKEELQEMGNQIIPQLMHPDDFKIYLEEIYPQYQQLKDNELVTHEYRMKHKSGDWYWLLSKESIFLRDTKGNPIQIFGLISDITERKEAEVELEQHKQQLEYLVLERTQELETKNAELDKAMKVFVGRETKIFELEKRIKALQGK